jgi:hypothetical protein
MLFMGWEQVKHSILFPGMENASKYIKQNELK